MNDLTEHLDNSNDLLDQTTNRIRKTEADDQLVERCLNNALRIEFDVRSQQADLAPLVGLSWHVPLAIAVSLFVICILLQEYARQPASDRQFAAVHRRADSNSFQVFSDLQFEPASSSSQTYPEIQK